MQCFDGESWGGRRVGTEVELESDYLERRRDG